MIDLQSDSVTEKIIGCAIEAHRQLGPGLLESIYEEALCIELDHQGLKFQRQLLIPMKYRDRVIGDFRLDLLVENSAVLPLSENSIRFSKHNC